MEENKFEKQVRQKMEELKLSPSDSVWEHVKARIEKKKDRRKGLLILLLLLILMVPAGYWMYHSGTSSNSKNPVAKNEPTQENENNHSKKDQAKSADNKEAQLNKTENAISSDSTSIDNSKNQNIVTKENTLSKAKKYGGKTKGNFSVKQIAPEVDESNEPATAESFTNTKAVAKPHDTVAPGKNDVAIEQQSVNEEKNTPLNPLHDTTANHDVAKKEIKKPDTTASSATPKPITATPARNWQVGIFLAGGYSHVGNQLLDFGGYRSADYLQAGPGTSNSNGGQFIYSPSKVKKGGAFIAGIFVEKNISSKTRISFGLNYKSFSTENTVGLKNDTTSMYQLSRAFNDQHQYHNNFKFIELPVQFNFQLTKGKSFPLFWQVGITLSQMISSNALQFNQYAGTYYKDNSVFNKTQVSLNTGFSVAIYQGHANSILLGPYVSYAMSKMADEGLYSAKHFVFFGLHSQILFRKK
ncbi:MAG: hypothetical protein ABI683_11670 [Ginsengibacter sp.]